MKLKQRLQSPDAMLRALFACFTLACLIAAVIMPDRGDMLSGVGRICTQLVYRIRTR